MTKPKVYVIGVGMTKFCKPGSVAWDYPQMVQQAVGKALEDCKLQYSDMEAATVGFLFGGTCCAQRALYDIGLTGIPIYNVNNACASGSSAVFLGKQIIESGNAEVVLAAGFEKMASGSLDGQFDVTGERAMSTDHHIQVMADTYGLEPAPITPQMFVNAGREHMEKYGTKREHFAKIAYKNHLHSVHNENSQFRKEFSLDEVLNSRKIFDFLGLLECSPTSDGSAAAILCSENYLEKNPHLRSQAVEIIGMKLGTDMPSVFKDKSNMKMIGFDMIERISKQLWAETGLTPNDVQVIELHDCFAPNELITYEAIGLCPIGKGGEIVDRNDNTYGGKWVINPSGGLISKGHPIGATGVAQVVELSNQLRGKCGVRQVKGAKIAMQHNIGIGGAGVVALYRLADTPSSTVSSPSSITTVSDNMAFKSDVVFNEIKNRVTEEKDLVKKVSSIFLINITGSDGTVKNWYIDAKSDPATVNHEKKDVEIEINLKDEDFMKIAQGALKPDQAFMQGKMKLKGNVAKAMKLKSLLDPKMLKGKI